MIPSGMQLLESLLAMAAAQAAADSIKNLSDIDYILSSRCDAHEAFMCVRDSRLELQHAVACDANPEATLECL